MLVDCLLLFAFYGFGFDMVYGFGLIWFVDVVVLVVCVLCDCVVYWLCGLWVLL